MSQQRRERPRTQRPRGQSATVWVLAFTLLAGTAILPAAGAGRTGGAPGAAESSDEVLTSYRAFRRMHAKSERFNQEGWIDAWTELDASGFHYTIVNERGSEYVRNKVLRTLLQREKEIVAGGVDRAALTEDNYTFSEPETAEDGLRYVRLKPKRKDVMLVEGRMVLDGDNGELLRVEGKLAKNPSFWTSVVNVIRHFAKVDGVRVPVVTESIAKVRFAGESKLDVVNDYESINGRPVSLAARRVLASSAAMR